jgi:hypothetical protein
MRTSNKRQPGEQGKKVKKMESDKKSLKDLVAKDGDRVKGGTPHTTTVYICN